MRLLTKFSLIFAIALLPSCGIGDALEVVLPIGPQDATIVLDPSQRFQTITAWEATAQAGQEFRSYPDFKDELISATVNDLMLNRIRLEVRSGVERPADSPIPINSLKDKRYRAINDNDDPFVINWKGFDFAELDLQIDSIVLPMRKLMSDRGEALLINLNFVDFGPSDFEQREQPEEFAELILATFLHIRDKYGFAPDYFEVILEPDNDAANWTPQQVANAIVATNARLQAKGFHPGFIAPSTSRAQNAAKYIDAIAAVPGAMDAITEFSFHRYDGPSDAVLKEIAELGARYGKRTSMLELIGADQDTIHTDLKLANVSSWQQFTLAYSGEDEGGSYFTVDSEETNPELSMGKRSRLLREYFKHIRPGAVRIGASTSNPRVDPVAFLNSNGRSVVVIKAAANGNATITNLPAGRYLVSSAVVDDATANKEEYVNHNGSEPFKVTIPGRGVVAVSGVEPRK